MRKSSKHKSERRRIFGEKGSIRSYVWMYFIVFTVFILVLIWLFQYIFLDNYYRNAKVRDITSAANQIIDAYDTPLQEKTNRMLAFNNNFCIVITDEMGNVEICENNLGAYSYLSSDILNNNGMALFRLRTELIKSDESYSTQVLKNSNFESREILYCTKIYADNADEQAYLFIESSIEPIDSTVNIIREQLIYITIILFELAFIITMFISKRVTKPIDEITKTAKRFGAGDYDVQFEGKGYREIEELSEVLNNAKNEIRKVSDLRKDLIANISHDLRTPLTMVKAYAEMIRDLSGDNPVKRNEHIQVIIDEADRLSNLVNNLLELSKLESGNIELNIKNFSIVEKLNDCMTRYQLVIEQNGYDIKYEPDEDRIISADPDKLDQVIYNFINNAINYTGENKVIRVKQINLENAVRVEVTDNGKGISKELLPKVFDRYYRDAKVKRDVVGTGLGLSICKEILKCHKFAFGVQSEEGKGSTFWFEAPYMKPHMENHTAQKLESKLTYSKNQDDEK
ncbi:MAG: HAMP domain-containing sensor histidine kinase [Ruminococcus sp.]|nr:HAMP domain-containing sensor histidine kinase [Ruminococcus sp.]